MCVASFQTRLTTSRMSRVSHAALAGVRHFGQLYEPVLIIKVMLSPLSKIRPSAFLVFFLIDNSSASSSTKFMYSSKPCGASKEEKEQQQQRQPEKACHTAAT